MLLKDCPVGSVVRLVSFRGDKALGPWWDGEFVVQREGDKLFVQDGDGDIRVAGEEIDYRYQFEIVRPAPEPTPEPRITFTVGGQEFYIGQRVWRILDESFFVGVGTELEVVGAYPGDALVAYRKLGSWETELSFVDFLSTTPPAPHEWKRGDWARHRQLGVGFVFGVADLGLHLSFEKGTYVLDRTDVEYAGRSEPPE